MRGDEQRCRYVRLGDLPPTGRSLNHLHVYYEGGVSVFRAAKDRKGPSYRILPMRDEANPNRSEAEHCRCPDHQYDHKLCVVHQAEFIVLYCLHRRPAFEVRGRRVGFGSDGEPLLEDATIVKPIPRGRIEPIPWSEDLWSILLFKFKLPRTPPPEAARWLANVLKSLKDRKPTKEAILTMTEPPPNWEELWG